MRNRKLLIYAVFISYLVWGSYWVGICQYPIGEECISGRWMLFFSGLPATLITIGSGGVSIPELVFTTIIGGIQWAAVVVLLVNWYGSKRK